MKKKFTELADDLLFVDWLLFFLERVFSPENSVCYLRGVAFSDSCTKVLSKGF